MIGASAEKMSGLDCAPTLVSVSKAVIHSLHIFFYFLSLLYDIISPSSFLSIISFHSFPLSFPYSQALNSFSIIFSFFSAFFLSATRGKRARKKENKREKDGLGNIKKRYGEGKERNGRTWGWI